MKSIDIQQIAKTAIDLQSQSISNLHQYINDEFEAAVNALKNCKGRVVISGIGKSAIIAQKIAATFNSTGTPALFMHAADAIHGDLGMVQQDDIAIIISKSGDSPEIKVLVPLIKNFGNKIIGLVGNTNSFLAKQSDFVVNSFVSQEACPNNLAPTTSTTAQLVMGDCITVCLMEAKDFGSQDFAKYHPGGNLGKKLFLRVDAMVTENENPKVGLESPLREVILEITAKRLGAAAVLNDDKSIAGIITDGDVRRMLERYENIGGIVAKDIMGKNPKSINKNALAVEAFEMMRSNNINQLLVVNDDGEYCGVIHIQDLVREGII